MRIRWSPSAADDLESISHYLRENHPSLAHSTVRKLYESTRSIKQFPNQGRRGRLEGTREFLMVPLPHLVVYSVESEVVRILRVLHTSQDWPPRPA
jgi:addiction module RelE/StbE family toxin